MALVNLKSKYIDLNWSYNNERDTTDHTDYSPENQPAQKKFNLMFTRNQDDFYRTNAGNIGLDQVKSVQPGRLSHGLGIGNLISGLKSLPYSLDQKGGGWSKQPYVTFDYEGNAVVGEKTKVTVDLSKGTDFPKRGTGYPANTIDLLRIKSFLDTRKGVQFVDKQQTLQFMNPKTETGLMTGQGRVVENTRTYSVDNMLGQVKIEGTGGHLARVGAPTFGNQDVFYAATVGLQNVTNSSALNRLALLKRIKIDGPGQNLVTVAEDFLLAKGLGISTNRNMIFNYPGGPNSSYGVGNTVVGRYVDTTQNQVMNPVTSVMNYAQIAKQNAIQNGVVDTKNIKDFRASISGYKVSGSWDYAKDSQQARIGIGNPGKIDKNSPQGKPTSYLVPIPESSDKINALMPVIYKGAQNVWNDPAYKDSVKLRFECMSNDDPAQATLLVFRALLSNGFTDNHSSALNSFRYFGRGEEFFTYQGFTRQISFSFKVAAFSRAELKPLYNKLNYLISQVYPDYSPNTSVMRAPLVKLTLGDYFSRVPGFLESVNVTVDNAASWEINLEESPDVQQLPHVLEVAVSFKPIHGFLPKRQTDDAVNLITNNFIERPTKISQQ